jgi:hypothetical protein
MKRWQGASQQRIVLILLLATLAVVTGCSRQLAVPGSRGTADGSQLPFDRVSDNSGITPTAGFSSDGIPTGTEVAIRLQMAVSSADSRAGDSFQGALDEPMVVSGKTVVPVGTEVTGSVVRAKASGGLHDPGYLRVTLASISINGKSIPLRTSSIFAKGGLYERRKVPTLGRSGADVKVAIAESAADSGAGTDPSVNPVKADVKFSTGRRLTFRLAQPLHL